MSSLAFDPFAGLASPVGAKAKTPFDPFSDFPVPATTTAAPPPFDPFASPGSRGREFFGNATGLASPAAGQRKSARGHAPHTGDSLDDIFGPLSPRPNGAAQKKSLGAAFNAPGSPAMEQLKDIARRSSLRKQSQQGMSSPRSRSRSGSSGTFDIGDILPSHRFVFARVPAGLSPGDAFMVRVPNSDELVKVKVPAGATPGTEIRVRVKTVATRKKASAEGGVPVSPKPRSRKGARRTGSDSRGGRKEQIKWPPKPAAADPEAMRRLLMAPLQRAHGVVQCTLTRSKDKHHYRLRIENGRFLMYAKAKRSVTPHYAVFLVDKEVPKGDAGFLGKVRGNFGSTHYTFYDHGTAPRSIRSVHGRTQARLELGMVRFKMRTNEPRLVQLWLPKTQQDVWGASSQIDVRPLNPAMTIAGVVDKEGLDCDGRRQGSSVGKSNSTLDFFTNRLPQWDESNEAFFLDMGTRAKVASAKNVMLHNPEDSRQPDGFLFGKVDDDRFNVDIAFPCSLFQGFCLAISTCIARVE